MHGSVLAVVLLVWGGSPPAGASENSDWREITAVEDLWSAYPAKIRSVFASLDLQQPELDGVQSALTAGDTLGAADALLEYYRTSESPEWLRERKYEFEGVEGRQRAEDLLEGKITRAGTASAIPVTDYGGWDWSHTGPVPEDEFGYFLNRHRFFVDLLRGWQETGDASYARKFDLLIRDWIVHNPLPAEDDPVWEVHRTTTAELDWRDIGEVVWRVLEAGIRLGESWPQAFYGFQQAEAFTPAGRLLMLYSIPVQAAYIREYHQIHHNHATMEMDGLSFAGLTFPEFKQSEEWIDHAVHVMQNEINEGQVYPDGVQQEMSSTYHWVALQRFEKLVDNFQAAGRTMPEEYLHRIESMYDYLAYCMRPDGHLPLNNDSEREDIRPAVLRAAERYDRPEWRYIATNGVQGEEPPGLASRVFPWAGLHVMRSGWDAEAHWGFFKTGPYGIGHQHRDKLHLSVHAHGRDLLVDSGLYTYEDYFSFNPATWRGYFRSSFSQNVILVDGAGQDVWERIAETPHVQGRDYANTVDLDFARGTFSGGYERIGGGEIEGYAEHTRAVAYVRGKYWVVVDQITTDRPRQLQALWRYAPYMNIEIEGNQVVSTDDGKGNLRIVPTGDITWVPQIVQGQTEPHILGWYSERGGRKVPSPTVVYSGKIDDTAVFAWILVPAEGPVPRVQASLVDDQVVSVRVEVHGEDAETVIVPLSGGRARLQTSMNSDQ